MKNQKMMDHLFRQQYGKMVSILTRIFGLRYLETIEDAVQDTFINAAKSWQRKVPDYAEAWLVKAAKNRVLDLLRKIGAEDKRISTIQKGIETVAINELFLEHEVDDSVLRMIFAACNPVLNAKEQLSFSLKIISGFSRKEIAHALLLKEETVKKRLSRARKVIQREDIRFEVPIGNDLIKRLDRVLEVIYLIFNEGFYSNRNDMLIREELCGEAMRLTKVLLSNKFTATADSYALFALFCFQAARLKSKVNEKNEIVRLDEQDRSLWYQPLIELGHQSMNLAVEDAVLGYYHYEAAVAAEHIIATSYEATDWNKILMWYQKLNELEVAVMNQLNMAVVYLQLKEFDSAKAILEAITPEDLEQKAYLYYGTYAEYFYLTNNKKTALCYLEKAISVTKNKMELAFLKQKKKIYQTD